MNTLVLFSPEDTASNLNPADPGNPDFPFVAQGSISLAPLYNDPAEGEWGRAFRGVLPAEVRSRGEGA